MIDLERQLREKLFYNKLGENLSYLDYLRINADHAVPTHADERTAIKMLIFRSCTLEPIRQPLQVELASIGIHPIIEFMPFNQFEQEILDPRSQFHQSTASLIWLHATSHAFCPRLVNDFHQLTPSEVSDEIKNCTVRLTGILDGLLNVQPKFVIVSGFLPPAWLAFGISDCASECSQKRVFESLNRFLAETCRQRPGFYFMDLERLAYRFGLQTLHDPVMEYAADLPFSQTGLIEVAREVKRTLFAAHGKTAKCIILDLDNTLWGGVVGDLGPFGVEIGADRPGKPYQDLQRVLSALQSRGIILAIASKNNEPDALEVFQRNPGMHLKINAFASRRINWNSKVQSITEIAEELNIGLNSIVFIDDNPVERELVRQSLPEVFTPDIPDDSTLVPNFVAGLFAFEKCAISSEDRRRTEMYHEQSRRRTLRDSSLTMESFYHSLDMELTISRNFSPHITRIAQLTQKTNQFNLTGVCLTESEVSQRMNDGGHWIISAKLTDRFGDNGEIAIISAAFSQDNCSVDIEIFLMSCRVIGRTVERALLCFLLNSLKIESSARLIRGQYVPSIRNAVASQTYSDFGFIESNGNQYIWDLQSMELPPMPPWFKLITRSSDDKVT